MSFRFLVKIAALASTCWISIGTALAESRIALVIGNSNYSTVSALPNPANDAKAMAQFLGSAGFQVLNAPNLTQSDMRKTIGNFASMVAEKGPDTVALVFYAGHGLQVDGENFLVPVDAQIERETDVPLQAMRLADLMNAMSSVRTKALMVILDACRNNPFSAINKTTGRGLAIVDAPNKSLVSYSTAPGTEALDGDGDNSPYTTALTKIGQEPGLPIEQLLKRVRLDVSNATDQQQFPWESSSLTTEFSFFPSGTGQERTKVASNSQPGTASRSETRSVEAWQKELKSKTAREAYEIVVREDRVEAYQAYIALYPSQSRAPTVRTLLDRRKVMIAWYEAVTVNTAASYQAFLASYAGSDFAGTADRLAERLRGRSLAYSAFASAATCPCSQPTNLNLAPRQKRSDTSPTQNTGSNATNPVTNVAIVDPAPVVIVTDPVPPIVVIPPIVRHPPKKGNDNPGQNTGTGTTGPNTGTTGPNTGTGKPKPPRGGVATTGGGTATTGGGSNQGNTPTITRVRTTTKVGNNIGNANVMSARSTKIGSPSISSSGQMGMQRTMSSGSSGVARTMSSGQTGMGRMSFGRR